jgi:hypothetical protein
MKAADAMVANVVAAGRTCAFRMSPAFGRAPYQWRSGARIGRQVRSVCLFAHQELLNPSRRVDVRRDTRVLAKEPALRPVLALRRKRERGLAMTQSPQSSQPGSMATPLDERSGGLYRFLGCAADQYMTRAVISVTGTVTMVELEALFERYDFNSFPLWKKEGSSEL